MTNILYIITDLNIGGTEKMLFETIAGLDKEECKPVVVALKEAGFYADKLKSAGITVYAFDIYKYGFLLLPFAVISAILTIRKIARENTVSIIHTYLFQANIIARLAFMTGKRPKLIASIRVMEEQKKWQLFFDKLTSKICDLLIVNSEALKKFLINSSTYPEKLIRVVYNGIEPIAVTITTTNEYKTNPDTFVLSSVGRLHKQKGFEYLLEAVAQISASDPAIDFKLVIAGNGPLMKSLQNKASALNIKNKVVFTGWLTDVPQLLSKTDIFILPSLWEGTPNVILEAMIARKPVVATRVGGIPEIIKDNQSGLLVAPTDSKDLAEKIKYLIKNNDKALALGKAANETVLNRFSMKTMVSETENLYRRLLN
ncbi:MAG: hypothetical protein A2252_06150 [Elusimicrobia bacterium RIFOXYA2_FULL_39_19]|nr:MAG: hypothetical protein A2252_06150 [Elusimicrobia bacterium RIFOXYA2_FULL_39_19]